MAIAKVSDQNMDYFGFYRTFCKAYPNFDLIQSVAKNRISGLLYFRNQTLKYLKKHVS